MFFLSSEVEYVWKILHPEILAAVSDSDYPCALLWRAPFQVSDQILFLQSVFNLSGGQADCLVWQILAGKILPISC